MPGGVPETLGGGLGTILAPRGAPEVSQGRPETKKSRERTSRPPPQGPSWEAKFGLFVDFVGLFRIVFVECRFGRPPGFILSGFGKVFGEIFEHLFINFGCEEKVVKCHSILLFTVV